MGTISDVGSAFAEVYARHYPDIVRYATRRVGPDHADDIAAETFTIGWRRWAELPTADPLPWLYRTAANVIANERRRTERASNLHADLADDAARGDETVDAASDRLTAVLSVLHRLSESDQEVLRLHVWEELDGKRLAIVLNCSQTAAGVRLHRARKRLRSALAQADAEQRSTAKPTGPVISDNVVGWNRRDQR